MKTLFLCFLLITINSNIHCCAKTSNQDLIYNIESQLHISNGLFSPFWFSSNKHGTIANSANSVLFRTSLLYKKHLSKKWTINTGIDFITASSKYPKACIQQLYCDITWENLQLSIGSKEYYDTQISRNKNLSSGLLVEGFNARPIPQIRVETKEYIPIPKTKKSLAVKFHLSYGKFIDEQWQKKFTSSGRTFTEKILYHSKSLMIRVGNPQKSILNLEFGLNMATQFGGIQYIKMPNGTIEKILEMPHGIEAYWKALIPQAGGKNTPEGEQVNIEGNMLGSWNFILNGRIKQTKFKVYLEHFFEDQSQMFWEYGSWKDGLLGLEVKINKKYINNIIYEILNTRNQSGPLLYDSFWGQFPEYQISAADNYYNHSIYGGWQHNGMSIGTPLIISPIYNQDNYIYFHSNRVKAHHIGITGILTPELKYRILCTYSKHLGTYEIPLDKERKQVNAFYEITYSPLKLKGWSSSIALGLDRGNYLGKSTGVMFSIKKSGSIF